MRKFWLSSLIITSFVFLMMAGTGELFKLKLFNAFDPIGQALADFQLSDYAFSNLREPPPLDDRIILVNIGNLSRLEVAQQLSIISKYGPRVIGLDSFFNCEGGLYDSLNCPQLLDTLSNVFLSSAIEAAGNVVLVTKLHQSVKVRKLGDIDMYDSLEYSDPMFSQFAMNAFASLPTDAEYQEDVKICRTVYPSRMVNGKKEYAFSTALAMKYDSAKAVKFLARGNVEEIINFRGNFEIQDIRQKSLSEKNLSSSELTGLFSAIDTYQVLNEEFDSTYFKDKIVIMGYLGAQFGDPSWDDKFFTPLNKKVAGRANPDMFGPVLHANVVAMILNEDYIEELETPVLFGIAFVSCFLIVALFIFVDERAPVFFDGASVIIQILIILLTSLIVIFALPQGIKLDLGYTLIATAFVGPCYDIFKSVKSFIKKALPTDD